MLGENYNYYKNIKMPQQLGMSDKGDISTLSKDVGGLISYVQLLVEGSGKASATGKPLGNKYFYNTGATCVDEKGDNQQRYIYVNNIPTGSIPFISSGLGVNFKDFKGLIPGTLEKLGELDPITMMLAFKDNGAFPKCSKITMDTVGIDNNKGQDSKFVANGDILQMQPCLFSNGVNPMTKQKCRETFENMESKLPDSYVYLGFLLIILIIICSYFLGAGKSL